MPDPLTCLLFLCACGAVVAGIGIFLGYDE